MGLVRAVVICAVLGLTTGKPQGSGSSLHVSLQKAVGDSVLFNISRDPAPYTNLSWIFKNDVNIISVSDGVNSTAPGYADRITLLADGSLELRNLTLGDRGNYAVVITSEGPEFNSVFLLDVLEPISNVRLSATPPNPTVGGIMNLYCSALGSYRKYAWYNKGQDMGLSSSTVGYGWTVNSDDTGPFRCEVYNDINRVSSNDVLVTIGNHVADVRLSASATELIEGRLVTLSCSAFGPNLKYAWYNQSQVMGLSSSISQYNWNVKRYDTGPFRCEVYNDINRVSSEDVLFTISYGPDVNLTVVPLQDKYAEGSTITLTCTVDSKPEAKITWTHDHYQLPFTGTELVLQHIEYWRGGRYTCEALNYKTGNTNSAYQDISIKDSFEGLSVGAQVGIALACVAVVGGAAAGLAYLYYRKRKS